MEKITFCEQRYTLPHCMILQGIGLVLHDTELILNGPDSGLLSDIDTIEVFLSEWRYADALNEEKSGCHMIYTGTTQLKELLVKLKSSKYLRLRGQRPFEQC